VPVESRASRRSTSGFVTICPKFQNVLSTAGLSSPRDFLEMAGEMISGHPDRNVARVVLPAATGPLPAFLKREYHIPWKDRWRSWRDGYGWSSMSLREARALDCAGACGVSVPPWVAAGEDGEGRAFLLLASIAGVELRRHLLALRRRAPEERRQFARTLGQQIARMHDSGISHPDLYAKHIFVERETNGITIIDWQRTGLPHHLSVEERCRDLAALHASIADELANGNERRALLAAYCEAATAALPSMDKVQRMIEQRAAIRMQRSSVREQRLPTWHDCQPLFWLDGEALAATPRCCALWTAEELRHIAYPSMRNRGAEKSLTILRPDLRTARLTQRRTIRPLGRMHDWCRGKRWSAPELRSAAHLLRQERLGAAPRLLAFGQRFLPGGVVDSFLLEDVEAA